MKMTLSADGLRLLFDLTDYSPAAQMGVSLMKTFRLPDDGGTYGLPPGVGTFKLYEVEKYKDKLPASVVEKGGVFFGMHQAEAR